jgi:hypothetical protein
MGCTYYTELRNTKREEHGRHYIIWGGERILEPKKTKEKKHGPLLNCSLCGAALPSSHLLVLYLSSWHRDKYRPMRLNGAEFVGGKSLLGVALNLLM